MIYNKTTPQPLRLRCTAGTGTRPQRAKSLSHHMSEAMLVRVYRTMPMRVRAGVDL